MSWFRRLGGADVEPVWYVATIRRDDGKVIEVPFRTAARGRGPVRRKARTAVWREGHRHAVLVTVRPRDA